MKIDFKNLYGICIRQKVLSENYRCVCLKYGWQGTKCKYWEPFQGSSYEELGEWQKKMFRKEIK